AINAPASLLPSDPTNLALAGIYDFGRSSLNAGWRVVATIAKLFRVKASTKRALVYLAALAIGYGLGFYDGAPPYGPLPLGPVLLLVFLSPILLAKVGALLLFRIRRGRSGSGDSGNAPFPRVPRPPTGRPPVLSPYEQIG